jgi:hypothetical protein
MVFLLGGGRVGLEDAVAMDGEFRILNRLWIAAPAANFLQWTAEYRRQSLSAGQKIATLAISLPDRFPRRDPTPECHGFQSLREMRSAVVTGNP